LSKNRYQSFVLKSQHTEVLENESKLPNFTSLICLLALTEPYWSITVPFEKFTERSYFTLNIDRTNYRSIFPFQQSLHVVRVKSLLLNQPRVLNAQKLALTAVRDA
jgi:hypothetical protein